jgi:hypothetical protein
VTDLVVDIFTVSILDVIIFTVYILDVDKNEVSRATKLLLPKDLVESVHLVGPVQLDAVDERFRLLHMQKLKKYQFQESFFSQNF